MPFWCSPKKVQLLCIGVTLITIISVLFILFISNWPSFARQKIVENLVFKNGTLGMQRFQNTSDLRNLRLSVSVFSVTNPEQVIKSAAKMQLKEYGPFVYSEFKWKEIIDNNPKTGLITYKLRRRFVFKPDLSVADPKSINITWLNVPVLSAISFIEKLPFWQKIGAKLLLENTINSVQEKPFITDSVENFIFAGSYRKIFAKLYQNDIVRKAVGNKWPLPDNKFAILYNRNNTWLPGKDYNFTVSAGYGPSQNYSSLNQYRLMNGSAQLPFWKPSGQCNQLGGTDGEFFGPFMDSSSHLSVYSMDICRKLDLKLRKRTLVGGVPVYQYSLDEKTLQSAKRNPDNDCYCLSKDPEECKIDGLIDLSTCVTENVYASGSHFIYGSPELSARVAGLRDVNLTLDDPVIDIEPNTGLSVQVRVPLQFNIKLTRNDYYTIFKFYQDFKPVFVPLLTVTEAAELEEDQATLLREKLLILDSWFITMVLGGAIVLLIVIIFVISILCMKYSNSRQPATVSDETDPLLGAPRDNQDNYSATSNRSPSVSSS